MQAARSAWCMAASGGGGGGWTLLGRVVAKQLANSSSSAQQRLASPAVHTPLLQFQCRAYSNTAQGRKVKGTTRGNSHDGKGGSHEVILYNLPHTVTHNDIRNACYDTAPSPDSADRDEAMKRNLPRLLKQRESVLGDIKHIRLLRTPFLMHNGKALVTFDNNSSARTFQQLVDRKSIAGKRIVALTGRPPWSEEDEADGAGVEPKASRAVMLLEEMQYASPGRVVLMRGLPITEMNARRLERILGRTYNLATDTIPMPPSGEVCRRREVERVDGEPHAKDLGAIVQLEDVMPIQSTTSFLVRTQTVADAMRLVRRWHRLPWVSDQPLSREQQEREDAEQEQEARSRELGEDDDGDWHENEKEDEATSHDERRDRDGDEAGDLDSPTRDPSQFNPKRFQLITDCYIMY